MWSRGTTLRSLIAKPEKNYDKSREKRDAATTISDVNTTAKSEGLIWKNDRQKHMTTANPQKIIEKNESTTITTTNEEDETAINDRDCALIRERVRVILLVGLIVANALTFVYLLLLYAACDSALDFTKIWQSAILVAAANAIPTITAYNVISGDP